MMIAPLKLDYNKIKTITFHQLKLFFKKDKKNSKKGLSWILPISPAQTITRTTIDDKVLNKTWLEFLNQ